MNLALLLPGALFALFAMALPLLIHLSRRSEQRPTDFAALRWLSAQLRPRRKLVFQEIPLLLLRLLLLTALAFFLANPVTRQAATAKHWLVVVPGADLSAAKDLPADTSSEKHWLAPGFPELEDAPEKTTPPLSSLLRELDARLPANTRLTVIVPQEVSGLDGELVRLSRKVDWKIVPGKMTPASSLGKTAPLRLAIRHDRMHENDVMYFKAAHAAWQSQQKSGEKESLDIADIDAPVKPDRTSLIFLSGGELPRDIREWVVKGGNVLVSKDSVIPEMKNSVPVWRNEEGKVLLRLARSGQGSILQWQQALKPQVMPELLDTEFPVRLEMLLRTPADAPATAFAASQEPLTGARAPAEMPRSLQTWLALFIAFLFLLERWLANSPRRWSAA